MKKLIVVTDWGNDSLTCQEFRSATEGFSRNPNDAKINFVAATPSTINTGFIVSQLVEVEERFGRSLDTVFFVNTDPRIHATEGVEEAKGAEFIVVKLQSGITLCGSNAGNNFSLIKEKIKVVFIYRNLDKGSQFRSRDLYSRVSAHLMDSLDDELELEEIGVDIIPELQGFYIMHIDNFGNIKTNLTIENLRGKYELNDLVKVKIGDKEKMALYTTNLFGGKPGQLIIYPGSSGKKDNPFLEISVWRYFNEFNITTGLHEFNFPKPGFPISML